MDPYLAPVRSRATGAILLASVVAGIILYRRKDGTDAALAGKLLVLLWCLVPLGLLATIGAFEFRKHAILNSQDLRLKELGRHFVVGYTRFDDIGPLAERGLIGGIFVTSRNIRGGAPANLRAEIERLQRLRKTADLPPLMVTTDQEGGIVSRLSPPLTALPALSTLAGLPPQERVRNAWEFGLVHGRELSALGVTLNFAPVVDLRYERAPNPLDLHTQINRRAISDAPELVGEIASAYIRGLAAANVGAAIKHFPGLGRVPDDTHHFRATLNAPLTELETRDWQPFRQLLAQPNVHLMVGHVRLAALDPDRPASHSKKVVNDLLRKQWGFDGLVITDDLAMSAVYQHGICTAVVDALNAGVDVLLVSFDGQQFYRIFACAEAGLRGGKIGTALLAQSRGRLDKFIENSTRRK